MVATVAVALIAVISYQSLDATTDAGDVSQRRIDRLQRIDRLWVLMENDLRNVLAYNLKKSDFEAEINAMDVSTGDTHALTLLRGGKANPLSLPRTEIERIGFRFEDDTVWRDAWSDPYETNADDARQQKIVDDVEDFYVEVLPPNPRTLDDSAWLENWPSAQLGLPPDAIPIAIRVTIELEDRGEISRFFTLSEGK